jgi:hypothetical protein
VDALEPVPGDSDTWDRPDAFLDVESLLEPRRAVAVKPPAEDRSIPADAAILPPDVVDDLDDDLDRFEPGHPASAARPGTSVASEAGYDRHSPEALAGVRRALAPYEIGQ